MTDLAEFQLESDTFGFTEDLARYLKGVLRDLRCSRDLLIECGPIAPLEGLRCPSEVWAGEPLRWGRLVSWRIGF
jgi:hypothetical protein